MYVREFCFIFEIAIRTGNKVIKETSYNLCVEAKADAGECEASDLYSFLPMKRKPSRRMCRKLGDLRISAPYQVIKLPAGGANESPVSEYRLIYVGV